jgi:hypothetical protein
MEQAFSFKEKSFATAFDFPGLYANSNSASAKKSNSAKMGYCLFENQSLIVI